MVLEIYLLKWVSVSDEDICFITNKYKVFQKKIDESYCSMRSLNVNDDVIYKTNKTYETNNGFIKKNEVTSCTIYSFIRRSHCKSNDFFRWIYSW